MKDSQNRWERLQDVYHAALELPNAEREAFITAQSGDDAEFLNELKALLAHDAETGDLTDLVFDEVGKLAEELDADRVGQTLGAYELIELIGSGGMGSVFRARRTDGAFEREAAIKLIKKGMDTNRVVARFTYERQVLARLQHPNIAQLLDGGVTDDGQPYFVMEYVDGQSLMQYCDVQELGLEQRLQIFMTVCRAVTYAHQNLVVHRDIKPGNVLINAAGEVKLLDFGIAKVLDHDDPDLTSMTSSQGAIGFTREYAAPEQRAGESVSMATDVFSLGVVLYELISGARPEFPAADEYGWVNRLAPPSSWDSHRYVSASEIRGDLDTICLHALEHQSDQRYGSAVELAADIERYLDNRPVVARKATAGYVMGKFARRHRLGLAASIIVTLGFASVIAFYTSQLAAERDAALLEQARTAEVVEFVTGLFDVVDPAVSKGEDVSARELLDSGALRLEFALTDRPLVRAALVSTLGRVYYALGDMEKALSFNEEALRLTRSAENVRPEDLAQALITLGAVVQDNGDLERARSLFDEADHLANVSLSDSHRVTYNAAAAHAYLAETRGEFETAEQKFIEALDLAEQYVGEDSDEVVAKAMVQLAGILRLNDKHLEAELLLDDALAIQERVYGGMHPESANTKRHLAGVYRDTDRWDEAIALYKVVIEERTKMLGPFHREVAHTWNSYAQVLTHASKHNEALDAYDKVLEILNQLRKGKPHVSYPAILNNRAFALMSNMQHEEALPYFEECLVEMERVGMAAGHPNRTFPETGIGEAYLYMDRFRDAETVFRRMLEERREHWPEEHTLVTEIKSHLGAALAHQGKFDEGERWLREALTQHEANYGTTYRGYHKTLKRLFTLFDLSGQETAKATWPDFDPEEFTYR